jgi:murein DD-endopeptidase MepM/ murein hydrolase activator NlpD
MKRFIVILLLSATNLMAEELKLVLPTQNHHLFTGELDRFYMYVDRNFEGEVSKPWQGGSFGFVRSPRRVDGKVVMTRFHEGLDIAPVKRDKAGNPLDLVMSISDGVVAHTSPISGRSNYGRYLVIEHEWEDSKVYSLYAHLAEITVAPGDRVKAGSVVGRMGYTGVGLNRTRAHLHFELGFLMSRDFQGWYDQYFATRNYHFNFNGMNIAGIDVASFYLEHRKNPELRFSDFVLSRPTQFKVTIPAGGEEPEFLARYPWMKRDGSEAAVSWEVGFAATGHVISFTPTERSVPKPVLTHLRPSDINQSYLTRGLIQGEGESASLSTNGKRLLSLVLDDFPTSN